MVKQLRKWHRVIQMKAPIIAYDVCNVMKYEFSVANANHENDLKHSTV